MTVHRTPNAQDLALVMEAIERLGFEPVALMKSLLQRDGVLPNGTCVGFRWLDKHNGNGPVQTWSTWSFAVEDGTARLFSGLYDLEDRNAAIDAAREDLR